MVNAYIVLPQGSTQEKSSFTATVYFRESNAATTPTTARYRIDDNSTGDSIRGWTDLTPAVSIEITIEPDDNQIVSSTRREERRQITIEANTGLSTQTRELAYWTVKRIEEF